MEKRIKTIYILTSVALALLFVMQGVWLYSQVLSEQKQIEKEVIESVEQVLEKDRKERKERKTTNSEKETAVVSLSSNIDYNNDKATNANIISIALKDSTYVFTVKENVSQDKIFDAPMRFILSHQTPLKTEAIDSLLRSENIKANISIVRFDSMIWESTSYIDGSLLTIDMPFNNLEGECIRVQYSIPLSDIVRGMGVTLILSILLSLLVIYCFIYQIRTIQRQRKVDEVRRDFLHTMIHELKRPISTLKMCVSSLRNERLIQNNDFKEEVLQNSYKELDNLSSYFAKLRDITMSQSNAVPLNIEEVELSEIIKETVEKTPVPNGKKVNFVITGKERISIMADRMHLQNILYNLFENSIKYSRDSVAITVDYKCDSGYLVLSVADNAVGIHQSDLPYIFKKFYRGRNLNSTSGIGLGLSYVKMLIEAHRGVISVESTLNVGTKFTVKLPL